MAGTSRPLPYLISFSLILIFNARLRCPYFIRTLPYISDRSAATSCSFCHNTPGGLRQTRTHLGLAKLALFSPNHVLHDRRGLVRIGLFRIAHVLSRHTGYSISEDPEEEPIEEEPLDEPKEEGLLEESEKEADSDLLSDARSRPGPAESSDSCESKVKPKRGPT
ncbi:hypothetical protein Tco_0978312 [Tanacetum coccineum]|uniref:Uncharacterized protein n=1 Tax=Tanacetum coccineum TaxID=301880 RepID=A0ABQ5EMQ0_9ASTR